MAAWLVVCTREVFRGMGDSEWAGANRAGSRRRRLRPGRTRTRGMVLSSDGVEYILFFFLQARARQRPSPKGPRHGRGGRDAASFHGGALTSSY